MTHTPVKLLLQRLNSVWQTGTLDGCAQRWEKDSWTQNLQRVPPICNCMLPGSSPCHQCSLHRDG